MCGGGAGHFSGGGDGGAINSSMVSSSVKGDGTINSSMVD